MKKVTGYGWGYGLKAIRNHRKRLILWPNPRKKLRVTVLVSADNIETVLPVPGRPGPRHATYISTTAQSWETVTVTFFSFFITESIRYEGYGSFSDSNLFSRSTRGPRSSNPSSVAARAATTTHHPETTA